MLKDKKLILLPALMCDERLYYNQINKFDKHCDIKTFTLKNFDNISLGANFILKEIKDLWGSNLENTEIYLAGISMGGYVAMELLKLEPNLFSGVCLINTTYLEDTENKRQNRINAINNASLVDAKNFMGINDSIINDYLYNKDDNNVELIKTMVKDLGKDVFINQQKLILSRANYVDVLKNLSKNNNFKAIIISGDKDVITPSSVHQQMHQDMDNSMLFILKDCSHLSLLDKPNEVNDILANWLNIQNLG